MHAVTGLLLHVSARVSQAVVWWLEQIRLGLTAPTLAAPAKRRVAKRREARQPPSAGTGGAAGGVAEAGCRGMPADAAAEAAAEEGAMEEGAMEEGAMEEPVLRLIVGKGNHHSSAPWKRAAREPAHSVRGTIHAMLSDAQAPIVASSNEGAIDIKLGWVAPHRHSYS